MIYVGLLVWLFIVGPLMSVPPNGRFNYLTGVAMTIALTVVVAGSLRIILFLVYRV